MIIASSTIVMTARTAAVTIHVKPPPATSVVTVVVVAAVAVDVVVDVAMEV